MKPKTLSLLGLVVVTCLLALFFISCEWVSTVDDFRDWFCDNDENAYCECEDRIEDCYGEEHLWDGDDEEDDDSDEASSGHVSEFCSRTIRIDDYKVSCHKEYVKEYLSCLKKHGCDYYKHTLCKDDFHDALEEFCMK